MKTYLFLFFFLTCGGAHAQSMFEPVAFRYVNTDNLVLRSVGADDYYVIAILHAGCKVGILPHDDRNETKQIRAAFYRVAVTVDGKPGHQYDGYLEKKYLVADRELINCKGYNNIIDSTNYTYVTRVDQSVIANYRRVGYGVRIPDNARRFPYPKYKGGLHSFPQPAKRIYHLGPRGGCYYTGANGNKNYVDPKYCK